MGSINAYSHEERAKTRALIKRLDGMSNRIEAMAKGRIPFNAEFVGGLTALTDTSDLEGQHRAVLEMMNQRRDWHMNRLTELARDDLTAFAEVASPHEPPAPHHIYVCDRLMEIEGGDRDRLILSMPPGHAKDLDVNTMVFMGDGSWKRLGDVQIGEMVITHQGRPREVLAVHDQGIRPVLKIVTESGRIVRAHPDHLFLTPNDWTAAKDLSFGTVLSIQKNYEITGNRLYSRDEFAFVGYMMARAVVVGRAYSRLYHISNKFRADDPVIIADIKAIAERLGFSYQQKHDASYERDAILITFDDKCSEWLAGIGLWHAPKSEVRVPEWIFKGDDHCIAAFLGAIISCDATFKPSPVKTYEGQKLVSVNGRGYVPSSAPAYRKLAFSILDNYPLAVDLARLFMRLGIKAGVHTGARLLNIKTKGAFRCEILDIPSQARIRSRIPIIGSTHRFWELPIEVLSWQHPDFHSDRIISIEPDGETETRCLTVEEDHSFIAEGLVVHNSTYASRYYPAWYLGRKENRIYLQGGHTGPFAEKEFGRKTKDLVNSDAFRRSFTDVAVRWDAKANGDWMLTNGNRYVTKGVGEGISGFRSTNNGIDDPYPTFRDAQNTKYRQKVWDWFVNDFMTRLLPQGNAFIISTRWHMNDVIGQLLEMLAEENNELGHWDFINLPVFCKDPETDQMGRELGDPLWPDFYTRETLMRQKALMSAIQWAALYDGEPVPAEGNIIKAKWLKLRFKLPPMLHVNSIAGSLYKEEHLRDPENSKVPGANPGDPENSNGAGANPGDPANSKRAGEDSGEENVSDTEHLPRIIESAPPFIRTVISVDSAEKDTDRADFSALTVWRETIDRRHYLVDAHRERMEFPRLVQCVDEYARLWDADTVLMETKGAGNQYIQHVEADEERRGFVVVPIEPGKDGKIFRMDAVTPIFMGNRVILPERASWLADYERELLQFPGSKNDDYADSTSQYLKWIKQTGASRRGTKKLR